MGDDLVAVKIEVDPFFRTATLRTAEQAPVKGARGFDVVDRKSEMEGRERVHGAVST